MQVTPQMILSSAFKLITSFKTYKPVQIGCRKCKQLSGGKYNVIKTQALCLFNLAYLREPRPSRLNQRGWEEASSHNWIILRVLSPLTSPFWPLPLLSNRSLNFFENLQFTGRGTYLIFPAQYWHSGPCQPSAHTQVSFSHLPFKQFWSLQLEAT